MNLSKRLRRRRRIRMEARSSNRIRGPWECPGEPGWYECWAVDDRWKGQMRYRAWASGIWWTPLRDGWLSSRMGIYRWRGPVANVHGAAPDGTDVTSTPHRAPANTMETAFHGEAVEDRMMTFMVNGEPQRRRYHMAMVDDVLGRHPGNPPQARIEPELRDGERALYMLGELMPSIIRDS